MTSLINFKATLIIVSKSDISKYKVYVGDHSKDAVDQNEQSMEISNIFRHPNYDNHKKTNDFAILITNQAIDFKFPNVKPVCLPSERDAERLNGDLTGLRGTISGWGSGWDLDGTATANVFHIANVTVENKYICDRRYIQLKIDDSMICAGYDNGDTFIDSCNGDSGGPMTTLIRGKNTLVGVTSFGHSQCSNMQKLPGVYGRVSKVLNWIQTYTVGPVYEPAENG